MSRLRFRASLRDQQRMSIAAQRHLAMSAPEEKREAALAFIEQQAASIKPKRAYRRGASDVPLEATVIDAVADLLRVHPAILFAVRQNSGSLPYVTAAGKAVPVWFFKWVKRPEKMRLTDFWFVTKDARIGAIECKRQDWLEPTDDREREQAKFLEIVIRAGGIAGFARSADEAEAILDQSDIPPF